MENIFQKMGNSQNFIFLIGIIVYTICLFTITDIALLLFVTYVIACALNPLVDKLEKKCNRNIAAVIGFGGSIGGILFLLSLIVLPPVFRVVFEEKVDPESMITELDIKTLVCTKNNYYAEGSRNNDQITLTYYNDKVRTYKIKYEKQYDDITAYDTEKQNLGLLSTAYGLVDGIELSVTPNDTDLKIISTEQCTPGIFKATVVTLPDTEQEFKINAKYTTTESAKQIKLDLEEDGYKCKVESK